MDEFRIKRGTRRTAAPISCSARSGDHRPPGGLVRRAGECCTSLGAHCFCGRRWIDPDGARQGLLDAGLLRDFPGLPPLHLGTSQNDAIIKQFRAGVNIPVSSQQCPAQLWEDRASARLPAGAAGSSIGTFSYDWSTAAGALRLRKAENGSHRRQQIGANGLLTEIPGRDNIPMIGVREAT
jgi:hypothetical protein